MSMIFNGEMFHVLWTDEEVEMCLPRVVVINVKFIPSMNVWNDGMIYSIEFTNGELMDFHGKLDNIKRVGDVMSLVFVEEYVRDDDYGLVEELKI